MNSEYTSSFPVFSIFFAGYNSDWHCYYFGQILTFFNLKNMILTNTKDFGEECGFQIIVGHWFSIRVYHFLFVGT
jgi:hypothetical protein